MTDPIDTGTPELSKRHTLKVERGVGVVRVRSITGTPLERMLFLGLISEEQYGAIDDMLADMFRCGHVALKAQNLDGVRVSRSSDPDASSRLMDVRDGVFRALRKVERNLGNPGVTLLYALLVQESSLEKKRQLERYSSLCRALGNVLAEHQKR